jgi:hypothetical protein
MTMNDLFRVRYDSASDVLYVTTSNYGPAYGEEAEPGVFWRYLDVDDTLVGMTVVDYKAYWGSRFQSLIEQFSEHFHLPRSEAMEVLKIANV